MRNRFKVGDELEVLSPSDSFNKIVKIEQMTDLKGQPVQDAKLVQQTLLVKTQVPLASGDILRIKV